MPLKCLRDGQELFAFNIPSSEEWSRLRAENAKARNLRMACCPSTVVLQTSRLGTWYFAHARRGDCTTAPETAEHLRAKSVIVEGVRRTAWEARAEQSGTTPAAEAWIADVLATRAGEPSVAFEVQWSRQTREETLARQARYEAAGIRGLWFFRQYDFPIGADIPAFRLGFDEPTRSFRVLLPSPLYRETGLLSGYKDNACYWQQQVELGQFAEGVLAGRLQYAPALNKTLPLEVFVSPTICWRCRQRTAAITELRFAAAKILPGCADVHCSIYDFDKVAERGAEIIAELLPETLLKSHGVGPVKPRYSKREGASYISNGCVHCDALLGKYFDHDLPEGSLAFSVEAYFDAAWAIQLPSALKCINRWWFDDSPPASP